MKKWEKPIIKNLNLSETKDWQDIILDTPTIGAIKICCSCGSQYEYKENPITKEKGFFLIGNHWVDADHYKNEWYCDNKRCHARLINFGMPCS